MPFTAICRLHVFFYVYILIRIFKCNSSSESGRILILPEINLSSDEKLLSR